MVNVLRAKFSRDCDKECGKETLRIDVVEFKWMREDGDVEENKVLCSKNTTQQVSDFEFMFLFRVLWENGL